MIPVIPVRNCVVFPQISMPFVLGRPRTVAALTAGETRDGLVLVVAQSKMTDGDPTIADLYRVGTICKIESLRDSDRGARHAVVTGISRYRIREYQFGATYITAEGEIEDLIPSSTPAEDLASVKEVMIKILKRLPTASEPLIELVKRVSDLDYLTHICAAYVSLPLPEKQGVLENRSLEWRSDRLNAYLARELMKARVG